MMMMMLVMVVMTLFSDCLHHSSCAVGCRAPLNSLCFLCGDKRRITAASSVTRINTVRDGRQSALSTG